MRFPESSAPALLTAQLLLAGPIAAQSPPEPPNVILLMTDDQGWGDAGFQGHPVLRTPSLDAMARNGLRFERFYAAAPVCSPTRGSCLTGRHPYRYGVFGANKGHLRAEEDTLAETLRARGYATGHFGKWHLGTLTREGRDSNRGGARNLEHYAPPWEHGFDVCFSTEAKVPTYDPMKTPQPSSGGVGRGSKPGAPYGTAYWSGPGQRVTGNLDGDDSKVIMDRAIPFIADAVANKRKFLAVIWFHAPHLPVVAGERHLALYPKAKGRTRHYLGSISAIDDQVGRLRRRLRELGVAADTMLWFCSDNGPEGAAGRAPGSAGTLRGRKRSLFEGGVRVPALLEWPARIAEARTTAVPCSTLDYYPTILAVLGGKPRLPVDGIDLTAVIDGRQQARGRGIGFESGGQLAWVEDRWKLVRDKGNGPFRLFDLQADPGESTDLAAAEGQVVERLRGEVTRWQASCKRSLEGSDYR